MASRSDRVSGDGLKTAWMPPKSGKTAPAGGGRDTMPRGDGLKTAWKPDRGGLVNVSAAKQKVR